MMVSVGERTSPGGGGDQRGLAWMKEADRRTRRQRALGRATQRLSSRTGKIFVEVYA
jgi:hypothetical protein